MDGVVVEKPSGGEEGETVEESEGGVDVDGGGVMD